jgi:hypothetical protein
VGALLGFMTGSQVVNVALLAAGPPLVVNCRGLALPPTG